MPRLTSHQQKVMERLRAGEWLESRIGGTRTQATMKYRFSGGGEVTERTRDILMRAGLIHVVDHPYRGTAKWEHRMKARVWVAAGKSEASG
ncbi:MAG: hypothetical protein KAV00_02000 [Phycisphaerae bacterium]|nr:hypothetical protein [Phycisphaerae bacterium]